jgi:hypothetical protein
LSALRESSVVKRCASLTFAGLLALACAYATTHASAREILFIDLNNASAEIAAIRLGMQPGERLTITPSAERIDPRTRAAVLELKRRHDAIEARARNCDMRRRAECEALWLQMKALDQARERLLGRFDIQAMIEDLRQQGERSFDTVLISGHHSGGYFRGELAALDANDLLALSFSLPDYFSRVRSIVLLGCETGVPSLIGDLFVKAFPSARLIVGAEDNAPLRSETRNHHFIRAVVAQEPLLAALRDAAAMRNAHRKLMSEHWPVAMLWQREHYFSKEWSGRLADMPKSVADSFKQSAQSALSITSAATRTDIDASRMRAHEAERASERSRAQAFAPMHTPSEAARILRD